LAQLGIEEPSNETSTLIDKCHQNLYNYVKTGEVGEDIYLNNNADLLLLTMLIFDDKDFSNTLAFPLLHNYDVENVPLEYKSAIIALKLSELLSKSGCKANISTLNTIIKEYIDSINL